MIAKTISQIAALPGALLLALAALGTALLWAYAPTCAELARRWSADPQYSHGFLVPLFALALLWARGDRLAPVTFGFRWAGVGLLAAGLALHLAATYLYFDWLDGISLLPSLTGLCVLLGGWAAMRWAGPAIAFLAFMVPLPYRLEVAAAVPLQRVTAVVTTYAMQTVGLTAFTVGNDIVLENGTLQIVRACSGLSMLMVFFAMATAIALVSQRPLWEKLLLVASAVPIALVANVIRIMLAGVAWEAAGADTVQVALAGWAWETSGPELASKVVHEWAGWLMMPLAFGMLALELWVLRRLLVAPRPGEVAPAREAAPPAPAPAAAVSRQRRARGRWRKGHAKNVAAVPNLGDKVTRTPGPGRGEPEGRIRR
jgi:exosortase